MRTSNVIALLVYFILLGFSGLVVGSTPTVDLGYVKYYGSYNATSGINYFRGIPYAQPPIGDLRWRKPRPIEANNTFNGMNISAVDPAPSCYQASPEALYALAGAFLKVNQTEDCLILDVLVPAEPVSTALPVLFQIHGGGYTIGNAATYPGDAIVHASQGKIIYVSIQYRLGLFGFLAGSEIGSNGEANAGLLDQRAALDWVQRNIAKFGGDPSKVTIWGGSAGGGSVTYQLIAGGAFDNPPFRAAIPEYPWWQPLMNSSSQELQYNLVLGLANCTDLPCLRSLPSSELDKVSSLSMNQSYPGPGYGYGVFYYGPVVDGKFIRHLPDQEFKLGNFYKVPTLMDHDAYEGVIFTNASLTSQSAETVDAQSLFPFAGPSFFSRLYQLYPASAYNSTFYQRQTWFGDFIINCPTYYMATAMTDQNYNSSAVFKLIFSAGSQLHGATAPFLASADINYPGANRTIADIISSYWISFTVTGDPNPLRTSNATFWPSYSAGGGPAAIGEADGFSILSITTESIVTGVDSDARPQCDFFGSQGYVVSN